MTLLYVYNGTSLFSFVLAVPGCHVRIVSVHYSCVVYIRSISCMYLF